MSKSILFVMTSHDTLGDTGEKTGMWLEEFAAPFYVFTDAGIEVELASAKGGEVPIDPKSLGEDFQTESTRRYLADEDGQARMKSTVPIRTLNASDCDAVYYPGGHGPLWDLVECEVSRDLIEAFASADKPLGIVCHAPAVLKNVRGTEGQPYVEGKSITGFTNSEERAMGLEDAVPFLLEDMLKERGAHFEKAPDFEANVVVDGKLVTGQNPASSKGAAKVMLAMLE
ncbi:type 1 glutamine amidotransferase domain-containing protein [Erythrobacter sp. YT30]|uniref:type 1 glutamine amidotransferase domain-containing protein n=1 Tax=Erythrobacter sp. YT30 TaxID=1735012 RepID=UPI00076CF55D|nr:type 1 glutamine amidotransferase domain-containing protein [Erythrobacter sp. YT30]KWV91529.1 dimethylallyltransferase [Erythrobacter sp. YT30]